jgi:membrane associated rhomboid family serine protease
MLIPIGTDIQTRRPPVANWVLIGVNVLVYLLTDWFGGSFGAQLKSFYALDGARPSVHQYLTYQFIHGDGWHLLGNMLFLWIFGNAVCDRMGGLGYVLFYLAGGVFAGIAFTHVADNPLVGASGAIAAVTTAFLVLYPRVHITMLVWMFFAFTFQLPAMILIVLKMIVWDNMLAPSIDQGAAANVAYSAHLGGYAFGFVAALGLQGLRALPRNQFDMLALWDRWRRRLGLGGPVTAASPVTARPIVVEELGSRPLDAIPLTPVEKLREEIAEHLAARAPAAAAGAYLRLLEMEGSGSETPPAHCVLPRTHQLEIANYLAQARRYREAAAAYEAFIAAYPGAADLGQVRLFLGLIYARYLGQYERAVSQLRLALETLQLDAQRTLAEEELRQAETHLHGPA